jgi:hypothetical protein
LVKLVDQDAQHLQNCLCEWRRARTRLGASMPKRRFRPRGESDGGPVGAAGRGGPGGVGEMIAAG